MDRIVLAGALLHLVSVKPLLVVQDLPEKLLSAGLAIPLAEGVAVQRSGLIEFENRQYAYHKWDSKRLRWRVGKSPTDKVLLIPLQ